ncbi:MAG TPA: DUF2934 domain-containing protein [Accumulibacter sp.]|uniref:DUF2934 domain-containing protein n=1 Tax=Candidatus Accumulibacter cognatus TaxID=2954383 RepID=A0A080MA56_9PROT|nr:MULTISPECIES: DUF2934 domain-containing protein [Candidatus Accumulibacter]KFB77876.1 MAG: hypothetical protein AW06_000762 [Candidatus Accumulibacter cognatus]MBL8402463.1 DUF2934 domain-containing protein [Accumulibacter sp.]MBN8517734.1 DUF2934 domain-containing protein [Accumulibacter sp.]MBO3709491.1 DUF2934 domain-containing protein [Accumulibacter sp.]MCC2867865.1 DUF2934 domain-containing protein [Candidatus Accumulibacter phosphatis]
MTEAKSTTKRAPAPRKTTTATTSTAEKTPAARAAAVKKPAATAATAAPAPEKKATPKPAIAPVAADIEILQSAPTECATPAAIPVRPSPEDRYRMVQSAAYFIAEKDGFRGRDTDYWAQAEGEIAAQLGEA